MIEKTSLSALLKHYRLASGLSQEALVAHTGLSVYAISNLVRGIHRTPHAETFNLLSNALSLSSDPRALLLVTARFELDAPIEAPPVFPSPGLPFPSTALIGREQESPEKSYQQKYCWGVRGAGGFVLTRHPGCSCVHPDRQKPFWWLSRKNKSMSQFELKER